MTMITETSGSPRTISVLLIVSDCGVMREIRDLLAGASGDSIHVKWEQSLSSGLERLGQGDVNVILLDLSLQDTEEQYSLDMLREKAPGVPVLLLISESQTAVAKALSRVVAGYVIIETMDSSMIELAIARALADRSSREVVFEDRRFRALIENDKDGVLIVGSDGKVVYASPSWSKMFSMEDDSGLESWTQSMHPEDMPKVLQLFTQIISTPGATITAELRVRDREGVWRYIEATGTNYVDDPAVKGIVANIHDITERKRAEEAKEDSEKRFRALIEKSSDAFLTISADGRMVYASPSYTRMFPFWDAKDMGSWVRAIHTEDISKAMELFAKVLATPGATVSAEIRAKDSNGEWHYIEATGTNHLSDPAVKGIVVNLRDVTERRKADEALRRQEKFYRHLTEKSSDGILLVDTQGAAKFGGPSFMRLLGYSESERVGDSAFNYVHPDDLKTAIDGFMQIVANPQVSGSMELRAMHKDGSWRWLEVIGTNYLEDPAVNGIVLNFSDITARKQADEALKAKERYFRAIMDLSSEAMLLVGPEGKIIDTSDGLKRISGYTREMTIGASASDFIHPDDAAHVGPAFAEAFQNPGKTVSFEARLKNAQGAWQWTGCMITNLLDHPDVQGIVTHLVDISDRKIADERLRLREEFYRLIIEKAPDGVLIVDTNGTVKYTSPSFTRLLGYVGETRLGENAFEYIHPEDAAMAAVLFAQMAATPGASEEVEVRVLHQDKTWHWFHVTGTNHLQDPAVGGIVLNFFDITRRKHAEEALRLKEEFYRLLTEKSPDSILIMDYLGSIQYRSPSFPRLLGYTQDEEFGKSAFDWVHPEDKPRIVETFGQLLATPGTSREVEVRVRHKDGSYIWMHAVGTNHLTDPTVKGLIVNLRDISERKRAEEALLESQEKLRIIFESISDGITVTDLAGTIVDVNEAALRLYGDSSKGDTIGRNGLEYIAEKDRDTAVQEMSRATAAGVTTESVEFTLMKRDGTEFEAELRANLLHDRLGEPSGIVYVTRDITESKRAEEALQDRERKFRQLFTNVNDTVLFVDLAGNVLDVNDRIWDMIGYSREEVVGRSFMELGVLAEDTLAAVAKVFTESLTSDKPIDRISDAQIKHRDGRTFYVDVSACRLTDAQGQMLGFIAVIRDITQHKQAEEALQERERKFRQLFTNVNDMVVFVDLVGNILDVNDRIKDVFGFSRDEVIGRNFTALGALSPETVSELAKAFIDAVTANVPVVPTMIVPATHRDGRAVYVEVNCSPIRGLDEQLVGFVDVIRDITQRKLDEEALRQSEERYRLLANNMTDMVIIMSLTGDNSFKVTYRNPAMRRAIGFTDEEAASHSPRDMMTPASFNVAMQVIAEEMDVVAKGNWTPGRNRMLELEVYREDGTTFPVEMHTTFLFDAEGKPASILGVARDISERKRLEAELRMRAEELAGLNQHLEEKVDERTADVEKLLKHKDEFIRQLGHDLKSPLTPLVTLLPLLREDVQDSEQQEMVDIAIQNVNFMRDLVNKTLKLARLNTTDNGPCTATANMRTQLDAVVKGRKSVADQRGLTIEPLVDDGIFVRLEALDVQELFDNLISNAIKYSPEGGRIFVDAAVSESFVTVSVRDTGMGMNEEQLSHLFQEFYKADPSRHDLDSSGLGLSICRRIVERAGGRIWAESEGLGKGSTFYFTLPLAQGNTGQTECL